MPDTIKSPTTTTCASFKFKKVAFSVEDFIRLAAIKRDIDDMIASGAHIPIGLDAAHLAWAEDRGLVWDFQRQAYTHPFRIVFDDKSQLSDEGRHA